MSRKKRRPAPVCARCGESLEAIGGRRVVGTRERGVLVCDPEVTLGELYHPAHTVKLEDEFLVTYGAGVWDDESRARAAEQALEGMRPWICQKCADRTCSACGAPLEVPIQSTLLTDDGAVTHLMIVPAKISCINPSCSKSVEPLRPVRT